ncbi:variable surface protein [Plasmodium gonderi]|uniref:Variable surface protein n=1 Tax=Plasmodium gonderi TaxID=77519 RepID=A0A1Y1JT05_PLAGO|nr:variable surface protein [Plasmodium gonderi]GAW84585.1 variable surface protein [Plasmodium gonderi]
MLHRYFLSIAKDLSHLPSYIYYGRFNVVKNYCLDDEMEKLNSIFNSYSSINGILQKPFNALCFMTYFKGFSSHELCNYFYYWLGNNIIDKVNGDDDFKEIVSLFYHGIRIVGASNRCQKDFIKVTKDEFRKIKWVFDYISNYESLKYALNNDTKLCFPALKDYIEESQSIYNKVYEECSTNKSTPSCDLYKRIFPDYKIGPKLYPLNCNEIKETHSLQNISTSPMPVEEITLTHSNNVRSVSFKLLYSMFIIFMSISIIIPFIPAGMWAHKFIRGYGSLFEKIKNILKSNIKHHFYESEKLNSYRHYFNISYILE